MVTLAVISQCLDNAALAHPTLLALRHHPGELFFEELKLGNAALDRFQVMPCDAVGFLARRIRFFSKTNEVPNVLDLDTQLSGMANEGNPLDR